MDPPVTNIFLFVTWCARVEVLKSENVGGASMHKSFIRIIFLFTFTFTSMFKLFIEIVEILFFEPWN